MNDLERYVTRATRGLWGRRRQEARTELASHIFERSRQHMAAGQTEAEAQHVTLRELGAPELVSRELARVHTLPLAAPALALALLASGVGVLATRAAAQVRVPVFEQQGSPAPDGVYVAINSLKLAFLSAGLKMTGPDAAPTLSAKGLPTITLKLGQKATGIYDALSAGDLWEPLVYPLTKTARYINLASMIHLAGQQGWPVKIEGWSKPVLTIGPAHILLDGVQTAINLYSRNAVVQRQPIIIG